MNTLENNKLIAKFMGFKWDNKNKILLQDMYVIQKSLPSYNTSWNWLMTVVEKIENLSFNGRKVWTSIKTFNTSRDENYHEMILRVFNNDLSSEKFLLEYNSEWYDTKIDAVYNTVIEFIKWYNEQTK